LFFPSKFVLENPNVYLYASDFPVFSPILDIHRRQLQARIEAEVPASTVNDRRVGDLENLGCAPMASPLCIEG
jgi:hypothetical protein